MEPIRNPFRFGGEVIEAELVDRDAETQLVERTIRDGGKLFLVGPRRFGKSSILRAASERLTARGAIVLRVDADPMSSLNMLVEQIVTLSAARLKGKVQHVVDTLRTFFSTLRPEITFDISEHRWGAAIGLQAANSPEHSVRNLVEALHGLEKLALAQPASRPVGLIIDEFQRVIELGGARAEAQLRSAIQQHSRVGYVFAGSKTSVMTAMTMNADRPFYRLGSVKLVGPLPRPDFAAFIGKNLRKSGFRIADSTVIDEILSLAADVPYNVQSLASSCWEELLSMRGPSPPVLTTEVVRKALMRAVLEMDPIYTQAWIRLTVVQQNTLRAVLRESGKGLTSAAVVRTIGASPSTVQRALQSMYHQSILRDEPAEGKVQIRFDDPFFAHWIRMRAMP